MKIKYGIFFFTYLLSCYSTTAFAKDSPNPSDDESEENFNEKKGKREKRNQTSEKKPAKLARVDTVPTIPSMTPHYPSQTLTISASISSILPPLFIPAAAEVSQREERKVKNVDSSSLIPDDEVTAVEMENDFKLPIVEEILKVLQKTQNQDACVMCEALVQREIEKLILQKKERANLLLSQTLDYISTDVNEINKSHDVIQETLVTFDSEDAMHLYHSFEDILGEHIGDDLLNECKNVIQRLYPHAQMTTREIAQTQPDSMTMFYNQIHSSLQTTANQLQTTPQPILPNDVIRPRVVPVVQNPVPNLAHVKGLTRPQAHVLSSRSNKIFSIENADNIDAVITYINKKHIKPKINFFKIKFTAIGVKMSHNQKIAYLLKNADFTELESFTLEKIALYENDFNKLLVALGQSKKLKTLVLSKCELKFYRLNKIATHILSQLQNMEVLDLYGNSGDLDSMKAVVHAIANRNQLTHLNLGGNVINEELMLELAKQLPKMADLKVIGLGGTNCGPKATLAVVNALVSLTQLTHIGLNDNNAGEEAVLKLAVILRNKKSLQGLGIANNQAGAHAMLLLVEALKDLPQLTSLMLNGNQSGVEPIIQLAAIIPSLKKLESLNIMNNSAGSASILMITDALSSLKGVKFVYFQGNKLDIETMRNIAKILSNMEGLVAFYLTLNEEITESQILKKFVEKFSKKGSRTIKFKQRLFKDDLPSW